MEEKDQKIKELEDRIASLSKEIEEKDGIIEQKNKDIVGARKKYSEMSAEEKERLSTKETELLQKEEELERKEKELSEMQSTKAKEERQAKVDAMIAKKAGSDADLKDKMQYNLNRLKDFDTAEDDDALERVIDEAYSMSSGVAVNPVNQAMTNSGGGAGDPSRQDDFSDTEQGKDLASVLNLKVAKEEDNK